MFTGDVVTVTVTAKTPANANIDVGLIIPNGMFRDASQNGNTYTITVNQDGMHRIRIYNASTAAVTVSGTSTYKENRRRILFYEDPTFINDTVVLSTDFLDNVLRPFTHHHRISFQPWSRDISVNRSNINNCNSGITARCTQNTCGAAFANCDNSVNNAHHHTNARKNVDQHIRDFNVTGYEVVAVVVSSDLCMNEANNITHTVGFWGIARAVGHKWSYSNNSSRLHSANNTVLNTLARVRILQHELSHQFGITVARDNHAPIAGQPCVMDFRDVSRRMGMEFLPADSVDIWCNACFAQINRNAHPRPN
jgi:hypothetical protein